MKPFSIFRNASTVFIAATLLVACGENSLLIPSVQPDGGKKMTVAQFAAGRPLEIGSILDPAE